MPGLLRAGQSQEAVGPAVQHGTSKMFFFFFLFNLYYYCSMQRSQDNFVALAVLSFCL